MGVVPCGQEKKMRIAKDDVPVKVTAPGAVARLQPGFGDASNCSVLSAEFFSLAAAIQPCGGVVHG